MPLGYEGLVYDIFGHRCAACRSSECNLVLDHHRPLQAGHGLLHNAVPLCRSCNYYKGTNAPETFYDRWRLAEIAVLLVDVRDAFDERFGDGVAA